MRNTIAVAAGMAVSGLLLASPATAQVTAATASTPNPKTQVSVAYAFLDDDDGQRHRLFPMGWSVQLESSVSNHLAVLGRMTGSYRSESVAGGQLSYTVYTAGAGVVLSGSAHGRVRPIGIVFGGIGHTSLSGIGGAESASALALGVGVGIDASVSGSTRVRVEIDRRWLHNSQQGDLSELALSVGIGFCFR
jgi:hypothetical protein